MPKGVSPEIREAAKFVDHRLSYGLAYLPNAMYSLGRRSRDVSAGRMAADTGTLRHMEKCADSMRFVCEGVQSVHTRIQGSAIGFTLKKQVLPPLGSIADDLEWIEEGAPELARLGVAFLISFHRWIQSGYGKAVVRRSINDLSLGARSIQAVLDAHLVYGGTEIDIRSNDRRRGLAEILAPMSVRVAVDEGRRRKAIRDFDLG